VKPTDLELGRWPGAPTLSPSGEFAVVAVSRVDLAVDDYTSQLWLVPTADGGVPRQLTYGWRDSAPRYSPDGTLLAFVRSARDDGGKVGKPQIWVMSTSGGEPRRLTDAPAGAGDATWSPDSTRLAYLARELPAGREPDTEPAKVAPRRITTLTYRRDGLGFMDCPRQIWVTGVNDETGGAITGGSAITAGDVDHESVRWHPSADALVFVAAAHESRRDDLRNDVFVCRPDGTDSRALTTGGFSVGGAEFTADGSAVLFAGADNGNGRVARNSSLWSVPTDASAEPVRLTDEETYNLGADIQVTDAGVLFPNESRGAVELLLVPYDGAAPQPVMSGERTIVGIDEAAGRIVATVSDAETWGEVILREPDGTERILSDFNREYADGSTIYPMVEVTAVAADGYPVHGWLVSPSGDGPHPLLLMIHGGPFAQYGWHLFDEAQVYAGAGYAVLMANPRGSSGYGQAHGRAVIGDVGAKSAADLMAILDHVLKTDNTIDVDRMGVLGGSHGGFMTTWLAAHEGQRFRAAVSERAVNAIDSFTGSSDIGWFFGDDLYGPDVVGQRRQSPLAYANDIDIPMLIIHSEQDWRCPIEQGQRLFVALRKRGAVAEMLIFPGEGHEMSRSGLPSHRLARFEAIVDWFNRYVK
jgi:dipeptidyl aminopeptidase/acylaminoacyl peptidase